MSKKSYPGQVKEAREIFIQNHCKRGERSNSTNGTEIKALDELVGSVREFIGEVCQCAEVFCAVFAF
jgi:hypothetical protein